MLGIVLIRVGSIVYVIMGFLCNLRFSIIKVLCKGMRVLIVFRLGLLLLYVFRETFLVAQSSGLLRGDNEGLGECIC